MTDIFISYAREDQRVADALARCLGALGWNVFVDRDDIPTGMTFDTFIEEQLNVAKRVVVLWSAASVKSHWVLTEAHEGLNRNVLMPVLIEANVTVPLAFRRVQARPMIGWDGDSAAVPFRQLIADIARHLGPASGSVPDAPEKSRDEGHWADGDVRSVTVPDTAERSPAKPTIGGAVDNSAVTIRDFLTAIDGAAGSVRGAELPGERRQRSSRATRPNEVDLKNLNGPGWVNVPAGTFTMGARDFSDTTPHKVTLSDYKISRYPVTNAQFLPFLQQSKANPPSHWNERKIPDGKEHHPVVNVSWNDAAGFCAWLTKHVRSQIVGTVHLPTEAQWEFAARGEEGRKYPWGNGEPTTDLANFGGQVGGTTPADRYPAGATPTGVCDLAGNVWEWCGDWYGPYDPTVSKDPNGAPSGSSRVLRGGSFNYSAHHLRAAYRYLLLPELKFGLVGFRVMWSLAGGQT